MSTVTVQTAVVGKEYVVFYMGFPHRCNTRNNSKHPCRVTVTKVGRLNIHTDNKMVIKPEGYFELLEIEEAKALYRKSFDSRVKQGFSQAAVDQYVSAL